MPSSRAVYLVLLTLILCAGAFLRFYPSAGFQKRGFDEAVYERYVAYLEKHSVLGYPEFCEGYLAVQKEMEAALPPPTRFAYVYAAHLWQEATGVDAYRSLVTVSALFTTLALVLTAAFLHRAAGPAAALGATALMSVAFNQIHQAQHAMIDGFFAFWAMLALWALWEAMQAPGRKRWLAVYALALAVMVMTKENAFFVTVALCGLLAANRWLQFGTVSRPLVLTTFGGALLGFVALVFLSGGVDIFFAIYQVLVEKAVVHSYAVENNDGPWYRYFVELMLASPLVLLLAVGTAFQVRRGEKFYLYLLVFLGITFALMANVRNGMNYRYTTIWDLSLRILAFAQLARLAAFFKPRQAVALALLTLLLCAFGLRQYFVFCMDWPSYALTPRELLHATGILK